MGTWREVEPETMELIEDQVGIQDLHGSNLKITLLLCYVKFIDEETNSGRGHD